MLNDLVSGTPAWQREEIRRSKGSLEKATLDLARLTADAHPLDASFYEAIGQDVMDCLNDLDRPHFDIDDALAALKSTRDKVTAREAHVKSTQATPPAMAGTVNDLDSAISALQASRDLSASNRHTGFLKDQEDEPGKIRPLPGRPQDLSRVAAHPEIDRISAESTPTGTRLEMSAPVQLESKLPRKWSSRRKQRYLKKNGPLIRDYALAAYGVRLEGDLTGRARAVRVDDKQELTGLFVRQHSSSYGNLGRLLDDPGFHKGFEAQHRVPGRIAQLNSLIGDLGDAAYSVFRRGPR